MITGEDRLRRVGRRSRRCGLNGVPVTVRTGPIVYRFADAARGEVRRPIATMPEISLLMRARGRVRARERAVRSHDARLSCTRRRASPRDVDVSLAAARGLDSRFGDASRDAQGVRRRESLLPRAGRLAPGRDSISAIGDEPRRAVHARLRADRVRAHSSAAILSPVDGAARGGERDVRESQDRLHPRRRRQRACRCSRSSDFRSSSSIRSSLPRTKLVRLHDDRARQPRATKRARRALVADTPLLHEVRARRRNDRHAVRPARRWRSRAFCRFRSR